MERSYQSAAVMMTGQGTLRKREESADTAPRDPEEDQVSTLSNITREVVPKSDEPESAEERVFFHFSKWGL